MIDIPRQNQRPPLLWRVQVFFEEIWPFVYKVINGFLWGALNFFKFILSGFKPF